MITHNPIHKKVFFTFIFLYCSAPTLHAMEKSNINQTPTALHLAAKEGSIEKMNIALNAGVNIDSTECHFNNTPLHVATWFGHAHCVTFLIHKGANLNITNNHGSTPLHIAAWKNESTCLKELIKYSTRIGTKNTTGTGNTELYLAAKAGSTECLQLLLEHNNVKQQIDLECSGDISTAIQAAGACEHGQCYWNLVIAGADYRKKIFYKGVLKKTSEIICDNAPLKNFIEIIEQNGKNNPPRFNGVYDFCCLCNQEYQPNNVIVTMMPCSQTFHADCFENYCVDFFIENNKNIPTLIRFKEGKSEKEFAHSLKTSPIGSIALAKKCPSCKTVIDPQQEIDLSVFL